MACRRSRGCGAGVEEARPCGVGGRGVKGSPFFAFSAVGEVKFCMSDLSPMRDPNHDMGL